MKGVFLVNKKRWMNNIEHNTSSVNGSLLFHDSTIYLAFTTMLKSLLIQLLSMISQSLLKIAPAGLSKNYFPTLMI